MTDKKSTTAPNCFVPAQPGFWVLELCEDPVKGTCLADRTPIVAWEMRLIDEDEPQRGYFAGPVTNDWGGGRTDSAPILGPDERVRVGGETTYDNEEHWLKDASAKIRAAPTGAGR